MKIGFSLSPGGLLLPYHLGALESLSSNSILTPSTPIAGSSAGAIAVASHAAGVSPEECLEATIRISTRCEELGGARGRLLPLLEEELENLLPSNAHEIVNEREGMTGLAYRQLFPSAKNILKTKFGSREEFMEDICNSSTFPFFTTNLPFLVRMGAPPRASPTLVEEEDDSSENSNEEIDVANNPNDISNGISFNLPRVLVDGYFTVPRSRFGCPILPPDSGAQRTVTISVFPHEAIGLSDSEHHDRISPEPCPSDPTSQLTELLQIATSSSSAETLRRMYDLGREDALRWIDTDYEKVLHMEESEDGVNVESPQSLLTLGR